MTIIADTQTLLLRLLSAEFIEKFFAVALKLA